MMQAELVTVVIPPNVVAMMSGVQYARIFPSAVVELVYCDGTTQSAAISIEQLTEGRANFFRLVSSVQDALKKS